MLPLLARTKWVLFFLLNNEKSFLRLPHLNAAEAVAFDIAVGSLSLRRLKVYMVNHVCSKKKMVVRVLVFVPILRRSD